MSTDLQVHTPINALAEAGTQAAIAEVQMRAMLAKRFPRDRKSVTDDILAECRRQSLAEVATYSYPRGGEEVTGPSIRLAEAIAQAWGNLDFGINIIEQRGEETIVEAFCWDMEKNTRQAKRFPVQHLRFTKRGTTRLVDPRDIYEMTANLGARRLRACILGVIPGHVVDEAVRVTEETLKSKLQVTPELIKKLVASFAAFKVTPEMITKKLGHSIESMGENDVLRLRKIYRSLTDQMSSPSSQFDFPESLPTQSDFAANMNAKTKQIAGPEETPPRDHNSDPDGSELTPYEQLKMAVEDLQGTTTKGTWTALGNRINAANESTAITAVQRELLHKMLGEVTVKR